MLVMLNGLGSTHLDAGLHKHIPMDAYLMLNGLGSTHLDWLAKSPRHYRYMMDHPEPVDSEALFIGSAVHAAALEPDRFQRDYAVEPDPFAIAPDAKSVSFPSVSTRTGAPQLDPLSLVTAAKVRRGSRLRKTTTARPPDPAAIRIRSG